MEEINILVNINKGYIVHFLTMLNSLSTNNANSKFNVYVLHCNLDDEDKKHISAKIKENINLIYLYVDNSEFKNAPTSSRYPYEIYYRIFAPLILPESVKRILYLDSDLIVHKNISELYNMDFGNNLFIACTQIDGFVQWFNRVRMCVNKNYYYMNTGVMMMNIQELRPLIDKEKIFKYIKHNAWKMYLFDEDVLFKFFGNRIKLIPPEIYNLSDRGIRRHNRRNPKNKIDFKWVENNNVIVHYLGRNKPWKAKYKGILADFYKRYEIK